MQVTCPLAQQQEKATGLETRNSEQVDRHTKQGREEEEAVSGWPTSSTPPFGLFIPCNNKATLSPNTHKPTKYFKNQTKI
jgi:hypothetical protein